MSKETRLELDPAEWVGLNLPTECPRCRTVLAEGVVTAKGPAIAWQPGRDRFYESWEKVVLDRGYVRLPWVRALRCPKCGMILMEGGGPRPE
jgi:phage FluMu protein Com